MNDEFADANPDAPVTYFGKTYLKNSDLKNCFRVGISLQPEFIIGHLTAGIHVGFYVFDPIKNLEPYTGKKSWDKGQGAAEMDQAGTPLNRGGQQLSGRLVLHAICAQVPRTRPPLRSIGTENTRRTSRIYRRRFRCSFLRIDQLIFHYIDMLQRNAMVYEILPIRTEKPEKLLGRLA